MSQPQSESRSFSNLEIAREVENVKIADPGAMGGAAYNLADLGQAVQFASHMAASGPMVPGHCQGSPAVCLGITMRALHWGFDPFGLAQESFQVKEGAPVGYSAKVFAAALQNCTGITLKFRYEGAVKVTDKPAMSARGNKVAERAAVGDRKCIAYWTDESGDVLEYETPILDHITIKNSALWHNDPDQQLAYYAARGWVRRYRPGVILGAFSRDEAEVMANEIKDVTPRANGFQRLAAEAKAKAESETATESEPDADETDDDAGQTVDGEADEAPGIDPERPEYIAGAAAALDGFGRGDCPHKGDAERAEIWFAGYDSASEGQDDAA